METVQRIIDTLDQIVADLPQAKQEIEGIVNTAEGKPAEAAPGAEGQAPTKADGTAVDA